MDWIQALILGLIQGLTEYLPVSSSGHLTIGQEILGVSGEDNLAFDVVVHVATVLSIIRWEEMGIVAAAVTVAGVLISMLCTWFSVNRFLRMKAGELYKI